MTATKPDWYLRVMRTSTENAYGGALVLVKTAHKKHDDCPIIMPQVILRALREQYYPIGVRFEL